LLLDVINYKLKWQLKHLVVQQFAVNPIGQVKTTTKGDKQECIATLSVSLKKELIGLRMNRIKKRIDHFVSQVMIK